MSGSPVLDPVEAAAAALGWDGIVEAARRCVACAALAASRRNVVPGSAPPGAAVLLVGEAPGAAEDAAGEPFVGRSGALLDEVLATAGLPRAQVAVTNVVKCRPPGNRRPAPVEVARCRPWLTRQIDLLAPAVVVALGGTAAEWFCGRGVRIAALRAQQLSYRGRPLVVTYHPAAALRFGPKGAPLAALRADLALAGRLAGQTAARQGR